MNKIVIIKIVLESLLLFADNKLNNSIFSYILKRHNGISMSEDEYIYWESKLLDEIFTKIPYFKIETTISKYLTFLNSYYFKEITELHTIKLISSYISDIESIIKRKINIEVYFHIGILLDTLTFTENIETTKNFIKENLNKYNTSSYVSNFHAQYKLFKEEKISLRDELSKKRYNQKYTLRSNAEKRICSKFNEESFSKFKKDIYTILEIMLQENIKENIQLIPYYYEVLEELSVKCQEKLKANTKDYQELKKNLIFIQRTEPKTDT